MDESIDRAEDRGDRWGGHMGLEILECTAQRVVGRVMIDERHHQPFGIVHGGVWCSLVEGLASMGASVAAAERGQPGVVGLSNTTDFLRTHREGEIIAVAEPLHVGRSVHLWQVVIRRTSDDKTVAHGQLRVHVLDELPGDRDRRAAAGE